MIDIKAIRKLCDKDTPGPWSYKTNRHPNTNGTPWGWLEGPAGNMCWSGHQSRTDAAFIAKSREIIPALLDELEAVKSELCQCCNAFSDATGHGWNENCEVCKYRPMYAPKGESHE